MASWQGQGLVSSCRPSKAKAGFLFEGPRFDQGQGSKVQGCMEGQGSKVQGCMEGQGRRLGLHLCRRDLEKEFGKFGALSKVKVVLDGKSGQVGGGGKW